MSFWVYIIESLKDHTFYIGITSDINKRLEQHNNGESRYTANKRPWKLFYFEEHSEKTSALKRELFLKKQKNRKFYLSLKDNGSDR